MKFNLLTLFFLFFEFVLSAQKVEVLDTTNYLLYTSNKKVCEIKYNKAHWQIDTAKTDWDISFKDPFDLVNAWFQEFDYFVSVKNLKGTIKNQYEDIGRVRNLKIYTKNINGLTVNYYDCNITYNREVYRYEGFFYNGLSGTIQLQLRLQLESLPIFEERIRNFFNGFRIIAK